MYEVFRAMKTLGFEWQIVNAYYVVVRRLNKSTQQYVEMALQLYQVDHRNYLLDFKSRTPTSQPLSGLASSGSGSNLGASASVASGGRSSQVEFKDVDQNNPLRTHQTLEFFEMCAELITSLAK